MSFSFLSPLALWLLLPVLFWGLWARFQWKGLPSVRVKHAFVDRFLPKAEVAEPKLRRWVWLITGVLMVLALAQPAWQTAQSEQTVISQQANGMIVLETSVNMLLQETDGQSRLQQAQTFLTDLLAKRTHQGRTGLSVFADEVYPVLSLTADTFVMTSMISRLEPALAGREDSALLEAVQFSGWALSQEQTVQPSWLLLVTDGAHTASRGQLDTLLAWLTRHHIQLYVLMLGQAKAPEQVNAQGLLYTPRNMALAEKLQAQGVSVVLQEDQPAVQKLIETLTQTTPSTSVVTQSQAQVQSLTSYLLILILVLWLGIWWQAKAM